MLLLILIDIIKLYNPCLTGTVLLALLTYPGQLCNLYRKYIIFNTESYRIAWSYVGTQVVQNCIMGSIENRSLFSSQRPTKHIFFDQYLATFLPQLSELQCGILSSDHFFSSSCRGKKSDCLNWVKQM